MYWSTGICTISLTFKYVPYKLMHAFIHYVIYFSQTS